MSIHLDLPSRKNVGCIPTRDFLFLSVPAAVVTVAAAAPSAALLRNVIQEITFNINKKLPTPAYSSLFNLKPEVGQYGTVYAL